MSRTTLLLFVKVVQFNIVEYYVFGSIVVLLTS